MNAHALPVLALAIAGLACLPGAAGASTILVAGEAKPTSGTVLGLVNGDTACLVELRDAAGEIRHESADFDVCFQQPSLVGRRVELSWTVANVMAESCGGDPECGDSDRIALIAAARIVDEAPAAAPVDSFCGADEQVVFACRTGAKLVSVCASPGATPTRGYVQYRFGRPDAGVPLELELPARRVPPPDAASADHLPFAGGGASWMRFRRGDHAYVVYAGIGLWGPGGETAERAGIVVERAGRRIAALACDGGRATGELGPDWFAGAGLAPRGEDFDLPP